MTTTVETTAEFHSVEDEDDDVAGDDDITEEPVARKRQLTPKGLEYMVQVKKKRLEQLSRALEKSSDQCMAIIDSDSDTDELQKSYRQWLQLYGEFLTVDVEYIELLSSTEEDEYRANWYSPRSENFRQFKTTVEDWFSKKAKDSTTRHKKQDDGVHSHDSASHISRASRHSGTSSKHSLSSRRADQEERKAELKIKRAGLQRKQKLQEDMLRLKLEEEELLLDEELAINDAKSRALSDLDRYTDSKVSIDQSFTSGSRSSTQDNKAMLSLVHHLSKPAADIMKFSGNPLEYQRFKRQFQTRILTKL